MAPAFAIPPRLGKCRDEILLKCVFDGSRPRLANLLDRFPWLHPQGNQADSRDGSRPAEPAHAVDHDPISPANRAADLLDQAGRRLGAPRHARVRNREVPEGHVDLSQGIDSLFTQLHQKTRYNIRYASRKGVVMRVGDENDLPMFHRLMGVTASRGGFTVRSLDYYRDEWRAFSKTGQVKLFIAEYQGNPIAVNMSAVFGKCAAYLHGGSTGEYANFQPNYLIMWEAMRWAHTQGCKSFDLWGIPDEVGISVIRTGSDLPKSDRTDGLWGVYRFKRGFSDNVVLFASAHDYAYSPLLYKLATNRYFSTDTFETIASFMDRIRN